MSFMDLFVPMFAAIISAGIVMEFLHFLLGLWLSKRQAARAKEYYADMAKKVGMDPDDFMSQLEEQATGMGGMGMMDLMGGPAGPVMMTTASGVDNEKGHGQYL